MIAAMRSNDVYRGFPHDVFAFTFIQEVMARTLNLEVGNYSHFVGSLHLYDCDQRAAREYLNEGFQTPISMPSMPGGDPWGSLAWLLAAERAIRLDQQEPSASGIDSYWLDLARLLHIKALHKKREIRQLAQQKREMASPVYNAIIRGRQLAVIERPQVQPDLPGIPPASVKKKKE
jgi:thymidylate synthase